MNPLEKMLYLGLIYVAGQLDYHSWDELKSVESKNSTEIELLVLMGYLRNAHQVEDADLREFLDQKLHSAIYTVLLRHGVVLTKIHRQEIPACWMGKQ